MTAEQDYTRALNEIAARYGRMENETVNSITSMLRITRNEINEMLLSAESPEQVRLGDLNRNVQRIIDEFEERATSEMRTAITEASADGLRSVTQPLEKIGFRTGFLTPSESQLNVILDFTADLIKGITEPIRSQVNVNVSRAALGQISNTQAMQNITQLFGRQAVQQGRMVVTGISAKAERDIRTELQRVFNLANNAQQQKSAQIIPGLLKRWIATADSRTRESHLAAHVRYKSNPIPVGDPFILRTRGKPEVRVMYPADPSGEPWETINCRCRMATIHPEIGVIGSSLDGRIAATLNNRADEYNRIASNLLSSGRYYEASNLFEESKQLRYSAYG